MVAVVRVLGPEFDWLHDDTEEDLVGASDHQYGIVCSYDSVTYYRDRENLPWFVGNQLPLVIPRHDGRDYRPSPDLCVHTTLGDVSRTALEVAREGSPALAIEFASPATAKKHDLDTTNPRAKPAVYALAGIAEYVVYDHTGLIVPEGVRAWRMGAAGTYVPWPTAADGRYHSALGLSFVPERPILRWYDPQGHPLPTNRDLGREREALLRERDAQARRIAALEAELRRLRGE